MHLFLFSNVARKVDYIMIDSARCRIGDTYFETGDEAREWVEAGNIGGTYSIIYQVYCPDHLDRK